MDSHLISNPMKNTNTGPIPLVSIILPVYNGEAYLDEAIRSILNQDYANLELLIIDDGSSDGSADIAKKAQQQDQRVKYVRNEQNMGLIATLNKAMAMAEGEYIGRIDSDDIWSSKDKLSRQMSYLLANPKTVIVGTWAIAIDQKGHETHSLHCPVTDGQIRNEILIKNPFIHPSVVFRKQAAIQAGLFKATEKHVEDYGLWMRLGEFGTFANIPEALMKYRVHAGSVTQSNNMLQVKNSLNLIREHNKQYPNFAKGYVKWTTKFALLKLFGIANFNTIKNLRNKDV